MLNIPLPPAPFPPCCHQAAPLCPAVGQRPLSVAQLLDRLRSGSAASAAEACVAINVVSAHCEFMARVGKPLRCPLFASVVVRAGLIPLFVGLLAKGGYAAGWACIALTLTCTARRSPGLQQLPANVQREFENAQAAFSAAGGVEALVELLAFPLRHPGLGNLFSLRTTACHAYDIITCLEADFGSNHVFKVRCIDAGIIGPLLRLMALEDNGTGLLMHTNRSAALLSFQLCRFVDERFGRPDSADQVFGAVPAIVTAFVNGGIAPIIVMRLAPSEG